MKPGRRLRLLARSTEIEPGDGRTITLAVGLRSLADTVLRHDPPTPAELERAIDRVADALAGLHPAATDVGHLSAADPPLLALPGLGHAGATLDRDAVEALFQRLASRAPGMPVAAEQLPPGRDIAAALLIRRECMHHLGFDRVTAGAA